MDGQISKYFSWHEAVYLPSWSREATESDGLDETVKASLVNLFAKMDLVREHFNKPIIVHVSYRPIEYNKLVGGAIHSAHTIGKACDFHIQNLPCDDVRKAINDANLLELWQMRMENLPGSGWVHLDIAPVPADGHRFFVP